MIDVHQVCMLVYIVYLLCLFTLLIFLVRSSRPDVICKKDVVKNVIKFKGKQLCQSLFFNKVAALSLKLY